MSESLRYIQIGVLRPDGEFTTAEGVTGEPVFRQLAPDFVCPICKAKPDLTVWHDQYCTYIPLYGEDLEHVLGMKK
jgi:rubredoxin